MHWIEYRFSDVRPYVSRTYKHREILSHQQWHEVCFYLYFEEKILDDLLKRCGIWLLAAALALIIIAAPLRLTAAPLSYSNLLKNGNFCARSIAKEERRLGIPHKLLHALSIKESGRWVKKDRANITWPWTVNAGGNGRHFNNRQNAIRYVRKLQKEGQRNIDIGCMQVTSITTRTRLKVWKLALTLRPMWLTRLSFSLP